VRERFAGTRWASLSPWLTANLKLSTTGLKSGDVIVQANLKEIWQPKQLTKIITAAKNGGKAEILILIESPHGLRYSLLPLEK